MVLHNWVIDIPDNVQIPAKNVCDLVWSKKLEAIIGHYQSGLYVQLAKRGSIKSS